MFSALWCLVLFGRRGKAVFLVGFCCPSEGPGVQLGAHKADVCPWPALVPQKLKPPSRPLDGTGTPAHQCCRSTRTLQACPVTISPSECEVNVWSKLLTRIEVAGNSTTVTPSGSAVDSQSSSDRAIQAAG